MRQLNRLTVIKLNIWQICSSLPRCCNRLEEVTRMITIYYADLPIHEYSKIFLLGKLRDTLEIDGSQR